MLLQQSQRLIVKQANIYMHTPIPNETILGRVTEPPNVELQRDPIHIHVNG